MLLPACITRLARPLLSARPPAAEYAQVLRMLGNGRLEAHCMDGVKRLCHIRGKMRKKASQGKAWGASCAACSPCAALCVKPSKRWNRACGVEEVALRWCAPPMCPCLPGHGDAG